MKLTGQQPTTNNQQPIAAFNTAMAAIGSFESSPALAVAVSGGADSMALLLLAHAWAVQHGGKAAALTIDHGLRAESAHEAQRVADWCAGLGIEHHILRIQDSGFLVQGKIQEAARQARYALLTEWCKKHYILHLLTAHHQGDQAETLFFRLARGSGVDGLSGMPLLGQMHGVRLLRPLLGVAKPALEAFLQERGQPWIDDPSNRSPAYTRNRIRQALRAAPGNTESRTCGVAHGFGAIRHALEKGIAQRLPQVVSLFPQGYATIDSAAFAALPEEYGLRMLAALALALSDAAYPPRSEKLSRLYEEILAGTISRRSCAGLLFIYQPRHQRLIVCREPNAVAPPVVLAIGQRVRWDGRFDAAAHDASEDFQLRALGSAGLRQLKKSVPAWLKSLPTPVLTTLPAFWHLDELAAAPHMQHINAAYRHIRFSARFRPAKPLAGVAFFSNDSL